MCESDEDYVPLNDGYNWKGDPNGTLSGQAIPQLPPGSGESLPAPPGAPTPPPPTAAPPPIAVAEYDPATGVYVGPDGNTYRQTDLARDANHDQSWQDMMLPPKG
jgi:phospholipid/cholesterol/gamma-HCH transport system substrate-binding protein